MEQGNSFAKSTITGTLWVYASRYSGKLVNLITVTILARLLLKEDFGVAGYATVVLSFLDFPGLGIGSALVYHEKDPRRTNTAFWLAVGIGVLMTLVMLAGAPLVGLYFQDPRAVPVTRWLALYFVLVGIGVVPSSLLAKRLAFRKKLIPDLAGSIGKAIISITLALLGFGAFGIVTGNLIHTLVTTLCCGRFGRPPGGRRCAFEKQYARPLLSYAASVVSVYFLGILILNVDYLIVGRYLGARRAGRVSAGVPHSRAADQAVLFGVSEVLFPVFTVCAKTAATWGAAS